MADSLLIADQIELLGDGAVSTLPECPGAQFHLAPGFDLSTPQPTTDIVASMLLDGERPFGRRASNRAIKLPIVIKAPDRFTLAGAREVLLQTIDQQTYVMTWTRENGLPLVFDCFRAQATTIAYSVKYERQILCSVLELTIPALPYGRSDIQTRVAMASPITGQAPPPPPSQLDDFLTVAGTNWSQSSGHTGGVKAAQWTPPAWGPKPYANMICTYARGLAPANGLTGTASTFEISIGNWVLALPAGNVTPTRTTASAHGGIAAMRMTSQAAGDMAVGSCSTGTVTINGMACRPNDVITVSAWVKALVSARSFQVGCEFYDSAGTSLGVQFSGSVTDTTGSYTQNSADFIAPAGAFWCRAQVKVLATGAAGEVHDVDDVLMTSDPADLTGLTAMTVWLGLGWDTTNLPYWRNFSGRIVLSWTLTDAGGHTLTFSKHTYLPFGNSPNTFKWSRVSTPIPGQNAAGNFDFTNVVRWQLNLSNWNSAFLYLVPRIDSVTANPPSLEMTPSIRGSVYHLLDVRGTARTPIALEFDQPPSGSQQTLVLPPTSGNWAIYNNGPGIYTSRVQSTGAGGAGAQRTTTGLGGGGKGGEEGAEPNAPLTPGGQYWYRTGVGGTSGGARSVATPYSIGSAAPAGPITKTFQISVGTATAGGDTIMVAAHSYPGSSNSVQSVTDTKGNQYSQIDTTSTLWQKVSLWRAMKASDGISPTTALTTSDKITVTYSQTPSTTGSIGGVAIGCPGLVAADAHNHAGGGSGTGNPTTAQVSTGPLSDQFELVIGVITNNTADGAPTWQNGFTRIGSDAIGTASETSVAYKKTTTSQSSVTVKGSLSSDFTWATIGCAFTTPQAALQADGTDTEFIADGGLSILGHGGLSAAQNSATGATAQTGTSTNTEVHSGGNGASGATTGGGGGSSGGSAAAGNPGANPAGGAAPADGGAGGAGGAAGGNNAGTAGSVPGGAGGGAVSTGGTGAGGRGADGQVKLTNTPQSGPSFSTLIAHMPGPDAPQSLSPLVPVPVTDTPNGGTEYTVPSLLEGQYADFKGTYSIIAVANSFNNPSASRILTITVKQYDYTGATPYSTFVARTFTPSSDITNGVIVVGELTLPPKAVAADNTAGYYTITVNDSNTSDRYQDVLLIDTMGQTVIVNNPAASAYQRIYIDAPAPDYALGRIMGTALDRPQATSILDQCPVISGVPMFAYPARDNLLLAYSTSGAPDVGLVYFPQWFVDRLN